MYNTEYIDSGGRDPQEKIFNLWMAGKNEHTRNVAPASKDYAREILRSSIVSHATTASWGSGDVLSFDSANQKRPVYINVIKLSNSERSNNRIDTQDA